MKKESPKTQIKQKIDEFFKKDFTADKMRKTKRLAMKYRISLKEDRKRYCKKCLSQLNGKTRIKDGMKSVRCLSCGFSNRWKIK